MKPICCLFQINTFNLNNEKVLIIYSLLEKDHEFEKKSSPVEISEPKYLYGILVDTLTVINDTVNEGQTLGGILYYNHIDHPQIAEIVNKSKGIFDVGYVYKTHFWNDHILLCTRSGLKISKISI